MTRYVVGFLHDGDRVVLIKKNRPEWQAGKLNGVGGHIESGESVHEAMIREFCEETGMETYGWNHFLTLRSGEHDIYFNKMKALPGFLAQAKTMEDEEIIIRSYRTLQAWEIIPNLEWILPLAMHRQNDYHPIDIWEKQ